MQLHKNENEFRTAVIEAAKHFQLPQHIIEKDYWITLLLRKIAEFEYKDYVIFKGGTSLSKGFDVIERFSEDIDLGLIPQAIKPDGIYKRPGEAIHRVIKKIKIDDFKEIKEEKESTKYRYKRTYSFPQLFDYPSTSLIHGRILLEINAFSDPYPTEKVCISSFIGNYLTDFQHQDIINETNMSSFNITALIPERTFCEKLLAVRAAWYKGPEFIQSKIRHVYDIHQLFHSDRIQKFVATNEFEKFLKVCHADDIVNQKISTNTSKQFSDIDIFRMPDKSLQSISQAYNNLEMIIFKGLLPDINKVAKTLKNINQRLESFEF